MSQTQWVQHISGQGRKWKIKMYCTSYFECYSDNDGGAWFMRLPVSEFQYCQPPERWEHVVALHYQDRHLSPVEFAGVRDMRARFDSDIGAWAIERKVP